MTDSAVATTQQSPAPRTPEYVSALLEQVVIMGDLSKLTSEQRVIYYREVCQSLGLNPLTRPFDYLNLSGRGLQLYANKTATDQLRSIHGINIDGVDHAEVGELYVATVHGHDREGRADTEVGAVDVANLKGERRANAIMKAITKAKRRLTLSLAGLGWLDDSQVGSIDGAEVVDVDPETGEIARPEPSLADAVAAKRAAITSGPVPPDGPAAEGTPQPGIADGAGHDSAIDAGEPPHPAAGAQAEASQDVKGPAPAPAPDEVAQGPSTPDPASPAEPRSDSSATRCEGFGDKEGRCEREAGHKGNHRNADKETWA